MENGHRNSGKTTHSNGGSFHSHIPNYQSVKFSEILSMAFAILPSHHVTSCLMAQPCSSTVPLRRRGGCQGQIWIPGAQGKECRGIYRGRKGDLRGYKGMQEDTRKHIEPCLKRKQHRCTGTCQHIHECMLYYI